MPEWPNSDMDKLFQEGSEHYDFEYNPKAWQQMDDLLNQQDRRRRALWWVFGSLFIALFLVLFSFFFFVENNPESIATTEIHSSAEVPENQPIQTPIPSEVLHNSDTDQQEKVLGETIRQDQALPSKTEKDETLSTDFRQNSSFKKVEPNKTTFPSETKITAPPIAKKSTIGDEPHPNGEGAETESENLVSFENEYENDELLLPDGKAAPLHVLPNQLPYLAIPLFTENCSPTLKLPISLNDGKGNNSKKSKPPFLIGLLGASEFNSVGQGDYTEMNWKLGLQLEYRFANRFSVKTGANYIHMWYDAGKGEYEPGSNFWVDGIAPIATRGQCNMVEIPILLSYHFKGYQNDGFFATAGLASYIILEEHYWYDYEYPPTDPIWYWGTYKDEQDWLNIGHLSGGYQKKFADKWSIQIGPYMQLPLTGVGHGRVKIYSLGLQSILSFSVK